MKWVKMPGDPRSVDDELRFILNENEKKSHPKPDSEREKKIKAFREKVDGMCNRNHDAGFKERSKEWVTHNFTADIYAFTIPFCATSLSTMAYVSIGSM
jgi:hypothetical protein